MRKSTRITAEEQFQAAQKKTARALEERERVAMERAEHIASLRARRLALEAEAQKVAGEKAKKKRSADA